MPKSVLHLVLLSVLLSANLHRKMPRDANPWTSWMGAVGVHGAIQIGGVLRLELQIEPALPHVACERLKRAGLHGQRSFELAFALQRERCRRV
jgi:hypothetical protein